MHPHLDPIWKKWLHLLALLSLGISLLMLPRLLPHLKPSPTPTTIHSETLTPFPIDYTDQLGRTIHIATKPERVITMTPSITETVFALGAGKQVIAVSKHCQAPKEALSLPNVGDIHQPNLEIIQELKPDLILTTEFTPRTVIDAIDRLGIPIVVTKLGNLEETWKNMQTLGRLVGHEPGGIALAQQNRAACETIRNQITQSTNTKPKTLLFYGTQGYFSAGKGSFAGELLEWAGAENLANRASSPWPQLSLESIIDWNPEFILITCKPTPQALADGNAAIQTLLQNPQWQSVHAIQHHQVFLIDNDSFTIQGVRMPYGIEAAARILHPNLPWKTPAH